MQPPIVCTLTSSSASARIEEWRQFLDDRVCDVVRVSEHRLRMKLEDCDDALPVAVDLARREKACCGFFQFSVELETDGCWLAVRVPPEAVGVLDDFAGLRARH